MLANLMKWIIHNKEWIFSGAGVFLVGVFVSIVGLCIRWGKARWQTRPAVAPVDRQSPPPITVIFQSWFQVERAVTDAADRLGCFGSPNSYMAKCLYQRGVLTDKQFQTYRRLLELRDRVIVGSSNEISRDEINRYPLLAMQLIQELKLQTKSMIPKTAPHDLQE